MIKKISYTNPVLGNNEDYQDNAIFTFSKIIERVPSIRNSTKNLLIDKLKVKELPDEAGHSAEGARPAGATAGSQTYLAHKLGRATSKCMFDCAGSADYTH